MPGGLSHSRCNPYQEAITKIMEAEFSLEELAFFEGFPLEFAVYRKLKEAIFQELPQSSCRVQKTQISFDNRRLYACVSLPLVDKGLYA